MPADVAAFLRVAKSFQDPAGAATGASSGTA
jgi:hypothetical protein